MACKGPNSGVDWLNWVCMQILRVWCMPKFTIFIIHNTSLLLDIMLKVLFERTIPVYLFIQSLLLRVGFQFMAACCQLSPALGKDKTKISNMKGSRKAGWPYRCTILLWFISISDELGITISRVRFLTEKNNKSK